MDKNIPIKIKSEKISNLPIWGIYQKDKRVDFYNRETEEYNGLTKQGVIDLLLDRGYKISR
jgi:hypothetical protein